MTTSIDTTIPTTTEGTSATAQRPEVVTPQGHTQQGPTQMRRRSRWVLAGVAVLAVAVPVTVTAVRSNDEPVAPPAPIVKGQPATPEDLRYAAEWAQRLDAMTPAPIVKGQPATPEDLRYAAEWAQRLDAMTPVGGNR